MQARLHVNQDPRSHIKKHKKNLRDRLLWAHFSIVDNSYMFGQGPRRSKGEWRQERASSGWKVHQAQPWCLTFLALTAKNTKPIYFFLFDFFVTIFLIDVCFILNVFPPLRETYAEEGCPLLVMLIEV